MTQLLIDISVTLRQNGEQSPDMPLRWAGNIRGLYGHSTHYALRHYIDTSIAYGAILPPEAGD